MITRYVSTNDLIHMPLEQATLTNRISILDNMSPKYKERQHLINLLVRLNHECLHPVFAWWLLQAVGSPIATSAKYLLNRSQLIWSFIATMYPLQRLASTLNQTWVPGENRLTWQYPCHHCCSRPPSHPRIFLRKGVSLGTKLLDLLNPSHLFEIAIYHRSL